MSRKTHCTDFQKAQRVNFSDGRVWDKEVHVKVVSITVKVLLLCQKLDTLDLCLLNMVFLSRFLL